MAGLKVFKNGSWVVPQPKIYKNGKWIKATGYAYKNGKWVKITEQEYTTTFPCKWCQTYRGNNTKRTDTTRMYQGYYSSSYGNHKSLMCFDETGTVRNELQGARIVEVKLWLQNDHWYWSSGGTIFIGTHNHKTKPNTYSYTQTNIVSQHFNRNEGRWVTLPSYVGEYIRDGKITGFTLHSSSNDKSYYGYFYGLGSSNAPQLRIKYVK